MGGEQLRGRGRGIGRSAPLQTLDWTSTALETISRASREQGVAPVPVDMVRRLVRGQVDAGHGAEGFDRVIEAMRPGAEYGRSEGETA